MGLGLAGSAYAQDSALGQLERLSGGRVDRPTRGRCPKCGGTRGGQCPTCGMVMPGTGWGGFGSGRGSQGAARSAFGSFASGMMQGLFQPSARGPSAAEIQERQLREAEAARVRAAAEQRARRERADRLRAGWEERRREYEALLEGALDVVQRPDRGTDVVDLSDVPSAEFVAIQQPAPPITHAIRNFEARLRGYALLDRAPPRLDATWSPLVYRDEPARAVTYRDGPGRAPGRPLVDLAAHQIPGETWISAYRSGVLSEFYSMRIRAARAKAKTDLSMEERIMRLLDRFKPKPRFHLSTGFRTASVRG